MRVRTVVLLDRSGSMQSAKEDHEGGLKSFVNDQKANKQGEMVFSLVQFDSNDPFDVVFDDLEIGLVDIDSFSLVPRGGTPLLDAMGKTIARIEEQEKADKSDQVILMVITDGMENKSREWTLETLRKAVEAHKDDWQILFLGANIDAFAAARDYGLSAQAAMNYNNQDAGSIKDLYERTSGKFSAVRGMSANLNKSDVLAACSYNADDYSAQEQFGVDNSQGKTNVSS